MTHCSLKKQSFLAFCALLILCSVGLFLIGLSAHILSAEPFDLFSLMFFLLTLLLGAFLCAAGPLSYACLTREYSVDSRGVTIRFLGRYTVFHPWERVTGIVLCDTGDNLHARPFPIAIRIAACEEKYGPFSLPRAYNLFGGMDKWRTESYALRRFRSIILIAYTEERMREIAKASGMEIKECWSDAARRDIAYRQMNRGE